MLRDLGRGGAVALLFAVVQFLCLADVGVGALLIAMVERTVFSTKSIVFDAWCGENLTLCATQIVLHPHGRFFSEAMNRIIAVLAHSVDKHQASLPQRSAKTSASQVPTALEFSTTFHKTPALHVPLHGALCRNIPLCILLQCFLSQLPRAA